MYDMSITPGEKCDTLQTLFTRPCAKAFRLALRGQCGRMQSTAAVRGAGRVCGAGIPLSGAASGERRLAS